MRMVNRSLDAKSEAFQRLLQVATLCNNAEYLTKKGRWFLYRPSRLR